MAKIAVAPDRALHHPLHEAVQQRAVTGENGGATARQLAAGDGWSVLDIICTSGPGDRPFEEQHGSVSIAIVAAGTFQYRASARRELLSPGSFLIGNPGQSYECNHDHGAGDRCIAFKFTPERFETLAQAAPSLRISRLPPLRNAAPLVARACAALSGAHEVSWEELAIEVAAHAARVANDLPGIDDAAPPNAFARVTRAIRAIEREPDAALPLQQLANEAGVSPFHFLRTFTRITGVTPHQFALRIRLREAAVRLTLDDAQVIDVAFDCGFGDVSHFNRSFRAEFGASPRAWRRLSRQRNDGRPPAGGHGPQRLLP